LLGDVNTGMAVHALYLWDRVSVKGKEYFPAVVTEVIGDHEDVATLGPMCRVTYDEDLTVEDVPQYYLRLYEGPALNRDPGSAGVGVEPRKRGRRDHVAASGRGSKAARKSGRAGEPSTLAGRLDRGSDDGRDSDSSGSASDSGGSDGEPDTDSDVEGGGAGPPGAQAKLLVASRALASATAIRADAAKVSKPCQYYHIPFQKRPDYDSSKRVDCLGCKRKKGVSPTVQVKCSEVVRP
jgi:hypothetical protein